VVFSWLTGSKKAEYVPHYSALRENPTRGLPTELEQQEGSESFIALQESLQKDLLDGAQRPAIETPLFTMLIDADRNFVALTETTVEELNTSFWLLSCIQIEFGTSAFLITVKRSAFSPL
jgi:hypothetical protein